MSPQRIQRARTRGWRMPMGAVYVGRPTQWGNPFTIRKLPWPPYRTAHEVRYDDSWFGDFDDQLSAQEGAALMFEAALRDGSLLITPAEVRRKLRGRDLSCWCRVGDPCHADVLLDVANEAAPS